ncbi:hypothetical protein NDU88_003987 [Pleurodeles waltl]|uniref:Uncharacterized protein n=1 Tax=Pleurodeles waltl TaxID=8319 RepID=A0AAV7VIW9_PLEWA|nr:hypothetical protein NDU88_003987 [Pleurodeles waltl]
MDTRRPPSAATDLLQICTNRGIQVPKRPIFKALQKGELALQEKQLQGKNIPESGGHKRSGPAIPVGFVNPGDLQQMSKGFFLSDMGRLKILAEEGPCY